MPMNRFTNCTELSQTQMELSLVITLLYSAEIEFYKKKVIQIYHLNRKQDE